MTDDVKYEESSGNIFEDIGLGNPEQRLLKAEIASLIYNIIQKRRLTQKEAGDILGINQPKVSALKNGRLDGFSLDRLFQFLNALDQDIDISIHPKKLKKAFISISAPKGKKSFEVAV